MSIKLVKRVLDNISKLNKDSPTVRNVNVPSPAEIAEDLDYDNPTPKEEETREEFIERFMSDEKAVEDFPNEDHRYAVALSYWENYQENKPTEKSVPTLPDFPIAPRDRDWDMESAVGEGGRVREYIGNGGDFTEWDSNQWSMFRDAHLWYDEENPEEIGSYKFPYVDIINDEPHIIPSAVFTIAGVLEGAMGGVDIPADDEERVKSRVENLYSRFREEFEDEDIVVPWEDNPVNKGKKECKILDAWRCEICNYVYLGNEKPDRCPHCGAEGKNLVSPKDYIHYEEVNVSDETRRNLERALELEVECESLYRCMEEKAENRVTESYFRRLARHESEHKEELAEMIGVSEPELIEVECFDNDIDNFKLAYEAEIKIIEHYKESIINAKEERAINVFRAFLEIEERHKDLTKIYSIKSPPYLEKLKEEENKEEDKYEDLEIDVPEYGNKDSRIAFVGASPSDKDLIRKEPLTGIGGKIFKDKYLSPLGLKKQDVFIINLVPKVLKNKYDILRQPNDEEIQKYSSWFIDKINEVNPEIIVALGNVAYRNLIEEVDYKLPHPTALYKFGDWGEVDRKVKFIEKNLEEIKKKIKKDFKILKSNDEKQIVLGIVLEPNTVDAHGDFMTIEEIERSSYYFMLNSQTVGLNHEEIFEDAKVVESYLAPVDFEINGKKVKKGTWLMGVKIFDKDKWKMIKDKKFNSFSIGAFGKKYKRTIVN